MEFVSVLYSYLTDDDVQLFEFPFPPYWQNVTHTQGLVHVAEATKVKLSILEIPLSLFVLYSCLTDDDVQLFVFPFPPFTPASRDGRGNNVCINQ